MRHYARWVAVLAALLMVLAACGNGETADDDGDTGDDGGTTTTTEAPATTTTEAMADDGDTGDEPMGLSCGDGVTVGVITDLTGALAIYGAHMNRGVPIGFAYATDGEVQTGTEQTYMLEDCEIRVVIKDDQSNPELSTTAARELIEVEGASIIIGSVSSGVTGALQGIARENDVILVAAPAAATAITAADFDPNTFRTSRSNYQDSMALCDLFVNERGYSTFVQIAPDYSFGYGGAEAYRDACTFFGGEFLEDDIYAPADTTDFTTFLGPLADTDADAFLVTWAGGGFVPLLQSAIDLGVVDDDTVLGSPFVDNVVQPAFFGNAIGTTSAIIYHYTAPDNAINDYLIDQVAANFDTFPDLFDADGMNAAIMVVEALRASNGATDAASLRDAMEGLSFEGPKGTVDIRAEDHMAIQDMYVVTLLNVDDPEFKYYEYVTTVRPVPPCLLPDEYVDRCGDLPVGSLTGG